MKKQTSIWSKEIISFICHFPQLSLSQKPDYHIVICLSWFGGPILFIVLCDIWVQSSVSACFHSQSVIRWHGTQRSLPKIFISEDHSFLFICVYDWWRHQYKILKPWPDGKIMRSCSKLNFQACPLFKLKGALCSYYFLVTM